MCSQNYWRVAFANASESDIIWAMSRKQGRVHVVRVRKTHVDKQGCQREYVSAYLRRTYRDGDTVRNETVANLSMLPPEAVDAIEATLKGTRLVPVGEVVAITRPPSRRWRTSWACPRCCGRRAGHATS